MHSTRVATRPDDQRVLAASHRVVRHRSARHRRQHSAVSGDSRRRICQENVPVGSRVLRAPIARDADVSPEHQTPVDYTLVGADAHYFALVTTRNGSAESLAIHTAKAIDREQFVNRTILTMRIIASLRSIQQQQPVSFLNVTVAVLDANEFDPEFVGLPAEPIHVSENTATGVEVWRVEARDTDSEAAGHLEYRLGATSSGAVRRAFAVESNSGRILVASAEELDYERTREFLLPIEVVDNGDVGKS